MARHQLSPELRVNLHQWGPTVVLDVTGRLIVETRAHFLGDLTELMTGGGRCLLVLDLSRVSQIDCSGIGQLVRLYVRVQRLGGRFALVNVAPRHKRLFELAGFLAFFPAFERPRTPLSRGRAYDVA